MSAKRTPWQIERLTESDAERIATAGMDQAPAVLGAAAWERFMGVTEFLEDLHAADMPDEHWYLAAIGVDPETAGMGLGSVLLRPVLEAADSQAQPCYLETAAASNRPFYERHGFAVVRKGVEPVSGLEYWTFTNENVNQPTFSLSLGACGKASARQV